MSLHYLADVSRSAARRPAPTPAHLDGFQLDAMFVLD